MLLPGALVVQNYHSFPQNYGISIYTMLPYKLLILAAMTGLKDLNSD